MNITFYLPTKDEWYGTYEGGYVEVKIHCGMQPKNITKEYCDWVYMMFIIFQGNDDLMYRKYYQIEESKQDEELIKVFKIISEIPLPITKSYLRSIGFEDDN